MSVHIECDSCGGPVNPAANNTARVSVAIKQRGINGLEHKIPAIITLDWTGGDASDTCAKCVLAAVLDNPYRVPE